MIDRGVCVAGERDSGCVVYSKLRLLAACIQSMPLCNVYQTAMHILARDIDFVSEVQSVTLPNLHARRLESAMPI